jgi:hypothetical protein
MRIYKYWITFNIFDIEKVKQFLNEGSNFKITILFNNIYNILYYH